MAETTTDVVDLIKSQHQQVKGLLTRVGAASGTELESAFCDLRRMIVVHETAEEEVVYPALRASGAEGQKIAEERTKEEQEGTEVLSKLEKLDIGKGEFTTTFDRFRTAVLQHAEAEEATVLPLLRRTQSQENLHKMANAFELAEKAAPTHAHPHTGTSAVSNVVTGPAVAMMDRVRDALRKT
jgi:hemerythrin superfamily protein